jgi:hypothetical protein
MHRTQIDNSPITLGVSIPVAGIKIRDLIGEVGRKVQYVLIDKNQPALTTDRVAILFTSKRPGAVGVDASDWTAHAKFIEAGEEYTLPFDDMQDGYLKPVAAAAAAAILILG